MRDAILAFPRELQLGGHRVARGVDAKGDKVTFEENLRNLRAFNAELRARRPTR